MVDKIECWVCLYCYSHHQYKEQSEECESHCCRIKDFAESLSDKDIDFLVEILSHKIQLI